MAERPSRRWVQPRRLLGQGRSASAPNLQHPRSPEEEEEEIAPSYDPLTYKEAIQSLGRAPTQPDLGPLSPVYLSSSLVPYKDDNSSSQAEAEQQSAREERMENQEEGTVPKEDATAEPQEAKAEYVPSSPQYVPASDDEGEMSSDEDQEAPYLAPREAPPNEDLKAGYYTIPPRKDQLTQPSTSESSGDDSVPDLIGLQEESQPPPVPPKRATHPTTLGLDKKQSLQEPALVVSPTSKGKSGKPAIAIPLVTVQPVREEEIVHTDDDRESSPLQHMQQQVD